MNKFESASILAGISPNEEPQVSEPTNLHVITGEVVANSENGTVLVSMDGLVFSEDDTQYIEMDTLGGLEEGDDATIILAGENGSAMTPLAVGSPGSVDRVRETAENASQIAEAAQEVAEATNQHFFADTNGIHVTAATQDEWDESHSGANVLINALGQLFRDGLNNLLTLTTEGGARALTIWDGLGNAASNVLASFSENGIGLAGDAFRLSSTKVADDPEDGVTSTTSKMRMGDKNSDYSVQSYLDTYIELGHIDEVDQDVANGNFVVGFDIEDGEGQLMSNANLHIGAGVAPTGVYTSDASLSADDVSLMSEEGIHISGRHISVIDLDSSPSLYCDVSKFISGIMCHSTSSAEEVTIGSDSFAASNRALSMKAVVNNSSSSVNGHSLDFLIRTDGINLYDYTTAQTLWTFNESPSQSNLTRGSAVASWSNGIVQRYGKVVTMTINGAKLSSALASGSTSGSIATIPTGYRPSILQRGMVCLSTTGNYANVWFVIGTTGNVAIANRSSLQIPTTAELSFQITYIID